MLEALFNTHGIVAYLAVLACLIGGAFGLPIPEDISLITAGALIHFDKAEVFLMGLVCYVGILAGDLIIFRIGWMAGPALFRQRWVRRLINSKRLHEIRLGLEKRTFVTILLARHLFYLRTATFLVCGSVRMSFSRFFIADAIAALITAPLMLTIGYLFANYYESVVHYANQVKIALLVLGLIVFGAVATYIFRKRWDTPEGTLDGGEVSDDAQVEAEIEQLEASAAGQGSAPAQPPKNV